MSKPEHEPDPVKAAHEAHAAVVKPKPKPELPVDFATLFMCAVHPHAEWPEAVCAWAAKAKANQHLLDHVRSTGCGTNATASMPTTLALIAEVLKAVKG